MRELEARSEQRGRHRDPAVLPPRLLSLAQSHRRRATSTLRTRAIDIHSAPRQARPGQQQVVRALRELKQAAHCREDEPDSPAYIRDRTPLKKGQITTLALREEFRKRPGAADPYRRRHLHPRRSAAASSRVSTSIAAANCSTARATPREHRDRRAVGRVHHGLCQGARHLAATDRLPPAPEPDPSQQAADRPRPAARIGLAPAQPAATPRRPAPTFTAEGVLQGGADQALGAGARQRRSRRSACLSIRMFDASDAFRLLGAIGAVRGRRRRQVGSTGGYETDDGGTMRDRALPGPVADAQPVKEFLEPQLRAAKDKTLQAALRADLRRRTGHGRRRGGETHRAADQVRQRRRLCLGDSGGEGMTVRSFGRIDGRSRRRLGARATKLRVRAVTDRATPRSRSGSCRRRRRRTLTSPVAAWPGLRGRNLELVEHRVLRRLTQAGVQLDAREAERQGTRLSHHRRHGA